MASSEPADTAFVAWGNAEILLTAQMTSPYAHLWYRKVAAPCGHDAYLLRDVSRDLEEFGSC